MLHLTHRHKHAAQESVLGSVKGGAVCVERTIPLLRHPGRLQHPAQRLVEPDVELVQSVAGEVERRVPLGDGLLQLAHLDVSLTRSAPRVGEEELSLIPLARGSPTGRMHLGGQQLHGLREVGQLGAN